MVVTMRGLEQMISPYMFLRPAYRYQRHSWTTTTTTCCSSSKPVRWISRHFSCPRPYHISIVHKQKYPSNLYSTNTRDLLAFAGRELTESPIDLAVIDSWRPTNPTKHLTPNEYRDLLNRVQSMSNKSTLVQYINKNGSLAALSPYLPNLSPKLLSEKTKLSKKVLVRALVHGIWNVPESFESTPDKHSIILNQSVSDMDDDTVMAKANAIPNHVSGVFEIPCSARDLFFVHGFGKTVQSLMLQGNVSITLDTQGSKIIVRGTGIGIKKTISQIRDLLHYSESEMRIPTSIHSSPRNLALASQFIHKIMRQCCVYTEQVPSSQDQALSLESTSPTSETATTSGSDPKLRITATSLVALSSAKQLMRTMWDTISDSKWHIISVGSGIKDGLTIPKFALLPFIEPHWTYSKLLEGVAQWTIAPVVGHPSRTKNPNLETQFHWVPLALPQLSSDTSFASNSVERKSDQKSHISLHTSKLIHYLNQLPPVPRKAHIQLTTQRGTLTMHTSDDIDSNEIACKSSNPNPLTKSLFLSPINNPLSLNELIEFTQHKNIQWSFQPSIPKVSACSHNNEIESSFSNPPNDLPDLISEWKMTAIEVSASNKFRLLLSAGDRQIAKSQRLRARETSSLKPTKLLDTVSDSNMEIEGPSHALANQSQSLKRQQLSQPPNPQSLGTNPPSSSDSFNRDRQEPLSSKEVVKEPTHVSGAPLRQWRIVYGADNDGGLNVMSWGWPGRRELVVNLKMPIFTTGGDIQIASIQFLQTAVTVDTIDLDRLPTNLRTEVQIIEDADKDMTDYFRTIVLPTTARVDGKLYVPPTFVFNDQEYTCKWIGRMAVNSTSLDRHELLEDASVEQVYMQASDESDYSLSWIVHTLKTPVQDWTPCVDLVFQAACLLDRI